MKVMMVGRGNKRNRTERYVRNAFESLGHEVRVHDDVKLSQWIGKVLCGQTLRLRLRWWKPDLIYLAKASGLDAWLVRSFRLQYPTVMWYFDITEEVDQQILKRAQQSDLFITVSSGLSRKYKDAGVPKVWSLPQAFPPEILNLSTSRRIPDAEVAFIGNNHGTESRNTFLRSVAEVYQLTLFGRGWSEFSGVCAVPDISVYNRDYVEVCRSSKIILAYPTRESYSGIRHYFSNRIWMTLGSGGFLMHKYHQGMEDYFHDGEHLVFFRDRRDALEKIDYYLQNPRERSRIADTGREYVLGQHTYRHRVLSLLTHLQHQGILDRDLTITSNER